ncbi:MAG: ribbon-helix-helix protein, CopG family [Hyphomonadaceae bacterium]|nr:ribbon-helix-helix protein, CopG family [Hyphomonadaceae bacterium]
MPTLNISLPSALESRVRELAAMRGDTPEALIEEAVERLLEDEADRAEITSRMKRFEETGQAFAHETVLETLRQRAGGSPGKK